MFYINNMTQMSCNFKEHSKIVRTGGISLWGRGASSQAKPPPPCGKCASAGCGRDFQARNRDAENGGGGNNAKPCRSLTDQHINGKLKTKIANTILLLFALTKCAYLLLVSFGTLWRPYIVGQSL
jgi:hypothetical protein